MSDRLEEILIRRRLRNRGAQRQVARRAGVGPGQSRRVTSMLVRDVLSKLNFGNSVAEFDDALERYFVETDTFRQLVEDRVDIVAGDKGTGKTALFKILNKRYPTIPELENVEVVPAFNVAGSPVFQRLSEGEALSEQTYMTLWKAYVLSLAGNWILALYEEAFTDKMYELDKLLETTGLRSADDSPGTVFSSIVNLFKRITNPKAIEATITISPHGLPIVIPRVELGDTSSTVSDYIPHDEAFALLNTVLEEVHLSLWLVLDRLDEAFAGLPAIEIPVLRALLRTYLDLAPFTQVRLKLFLRKDLFRRIIAGGFVNLTHINARRVEIIWDEDALFDLLQRRARESGDVLAMLGVDPDDGGAVFASLFPDQVDQGKRKPKTWTWLMRRIRDGNDTKPPRNLIDLVQKSQEAQIRREERENNEFADRPLIAPDALKSGLRVLSKQRVEDTLLAEAGQHADYIERFRNSKAEHNLDTLSKLLGVEGDELHSVVQVLLDIGFLEAVGSNYKIPSLYRDGLGVTQGKAFAPEEEAEDDED